MNYRPRHICVLSTFQRIANSIEMNFITDSHLQPMATTIDRLSIGDLHRKNMVTI